jgi:hypothetical protein
MLGELTDLSLLLSGVRRALAPTIAPTGRKLDLPSDFRQRERAFDAKRGRWSSVPPGTNRRGARGRCGRSAWAGGGATTMVPLPRAGFLESGRWLARDGAPGATPGRGPPLNPRLGGRTAGGTLEPGRAIVPSDVPFR